MNTKKLAGQVSITIFLQFLCYCSSQNQGPLPFPENRYLTEDRTTPTGWQLSSIPRQQSRIWPFTALDGWPLHSIIAIETTQEICTESQIPSADPSGRKVLLLDISTGDSVPVRIRSTVRNCELRIAPERPFYPSRTYALFIHKSLVDSAEYNTFRQRFRENHRLFSPLYARAFHQAYDLWPRQAFPATEAGAGMIITARSPDSLIGNLLQIQTEWEQRLKFEAEVADFSFSVLQRESLPDLSANGSILRIQLSAPRNQINILVDRTSLLSTFMGARQAVNAPLEFLLMIPAVQNGILIMQPSSEAQAQFYKNRAELQRIAERTERLIVIPLRNDSYADFETYANNLEAPLNEIIGFTDTMVQASLWSSVLLKIIPTLDIRENQNRKWLYFSKQAAGLCIESHCPLFMEINPNIARFIDMSASTRPGGSDLTYSVPTSEYTKKIWLLESLLESSYSSFFERHRSGQNSRFSQSKSRLNIPHFFSAENEQRLYKFLK